MPKIKTTLIDYDGPDEPLLRRLAGAVIVHWNMLDPAEQKTILDQASCMVDRSSGQGLSPKELRKSLEEFVLMRAPPLYPVQVRKGGPKS
jgi:hypothetical protein